MNKEFSKRKDIWIVNLDPTIGAEIKKSRPAVIISSDSIGKLPIKLISPITKWKTYFEKNLWHIKIAPNDNNGLSELSAVDVLQTRCVDVQRLVKKIGDITDQEMEQITLGIGGIIEYST
ncbi:MAG: type II toxin-antitoxin system PemK/MazF family toxin [Ignavibacteria bacterium]